MEIINYNLSKNANDKVTNFYGADYEYFFIGQFEPRIAHFARQSRTKSFLKLRG